MFCEKCGYEIDPASKFCENCGHRIGTQHKRKNVYIALILSFILSGLGTIYAGYTKKGLILIALRLITAMIGWYVPLFAILTLVVFIYGIYDAYCEVQYANGTERHYPVTYNKKSGKKDMIVIIIVFLLVIAGISMIMSLTSPSYQGTPVHTSTHSSTPASTSSGGGSRYRGVDDSPSTIARRDPDWYYDHYEYGDNYKIDDYLESQGFD